MTEAVSSRLIAALRAAEIEAEIILRNIFCFFIFFLCIYNIGCGHSPPETVRFPLTDNYLPCNTSAGRSRCIMRIAGIEPIRVTITISTATIGMTIGFISMDELNTV